MNYAFTLQDKTFIPGGRLDIATDSVQDHNRETEAKEMEWLKTGPDKVFLYVRDTDDPKSWTASGRYPAITTWLGTVVSDYCILGDKSRFRAFGPFPSVRQSVNCRIFGIKYHGWYFTSSGDYCRLKRSKG